MIIKIRLFVFVFVVMSICILNIFVIYCCFLVVMNLSWCYLLRIIVLFGNIGMMSVISKYLVFYLN